ncbi:uncharacterized protein [Parasteatoda tepidariorum]|uniref:uncharacterized protein n=1 Tax=Parasteatoda tepidariorum TaxID=114398 RepID=UPI00077FA48F|nr:uncharacterized protein LOC107450826 [Parasteatoda tepidariorum]
MKFFLICAGILLCFGLTKAETCNCVSYLISENGLSRENRITSTEYDIENTKCDGDGIMKCKDFCVEMYAELTDGGKTCVVMPGDHQKVGDWMCQALNRNVCNARVGIFVQSCGSDPVDTGFRFKESICCKSGKSAHC